MSDTPDVYALLGHTSWIHMLARSLVSDPHTAEDLVQDTWVTALEAKPDGSRSLRGWMSTVLRNHTGKMRSRDQHRRNRELDVSRRERTPSTLDVVEKASTHRDLVEAVLALDEPYRETVLMRFFEQLSYGEIAERMGTTKATVNSRLTRGLQRLRERLDRAYGNKRQAWLIALTPLAQQFQGPIAATTATKLMTTPTQISLAAALSVAGAVSVWQFSGSMPDGSTVSGTTAAAEIGEAPQSAGLLMPTPLLRQMAEPVRDEREPAPLLGAVSADDWVANLSHDESIGDHIRTIRMNTGAGDVEVLEGAPGVASVDATVSTDPEDVAPGALTYNFADHVKVYEEGDVLVIEDAHKNDNNENGQWQVSLTVRIPSNLGISANSGAGDVTVRTATAAVKVNSGAGDVRVAAPGHSPTEIKANSGAGDVEIDVASVASKLSANSGAGDVSAKLARGTPSDGVRLNSGAGSITFAPSPDIYGSFKLETGVGEITVPPSLGLDVERRKVGSRATGQVGQGGPKHTLSSGVGDITIVIKSVY